jgi:hypothetical protein
MSKPHRGQARSYSLGQCQYSGQRCDLKNAAERASGGSICHLSDTAIAASRCSVERHPVRSYRRMGLHKSLLSVAKLRSQGRRESSVGACPHHGAGAREPLRSRGRTSANMVLVTFVETIVTRPSGRNQNSHTLQIPLKPHDQNHPAAKLTPCAMSSAARYKSSPAPQPPPSRCEPRGSGSDSRKGQC